MEKEIKEELKEETTVEEPTVEEETTETEEKIDECDPAFKIKALEDKLKEQEESMMRLNAEYANFRRRTAEEKSSIGLFANEKIMNEMIPVIDNMERALAACEDKESPLYIGIDLVYKQMVDALSKTGLELIEAELGMDFDPNLHMAVLQEASEEFDEGKITMVLQKGYKLGEKILRATMVKVSC